MHAMFLCMHMQSRLDGCLLYVDDPLQHLGSPCLNLYALNTAPYFKTRRRTSKIRVDVKTEGIDVRLFGRSIGERIAGEAERLQQIWDWAPSLSERCPWDRVHGHRNPDRHPYL